MSCWRHIASAIVARREGDLHAARTQDDLRIAKRHRLPGLSPCSSTNSVVFFLGAERSRISYQRSSLKIILFPVISS